MYISFRQQCCLTRGKAASPIAILSLRTCMCTRMIQTHVHTTQPPSPHHGRQIFSAMDNSQIYTHKCRRSYDNRYRGGSILRRGQHFCRVHIHNIATPARPCLTVEAAALLPVEAAKNHQIEIRCMKLLYTAD